MDRKPMDQEGWQRFKATLADRLIEPRRLLYARTRNPTHALDAYRIARAAKIDVPAWVLAMFDEWAEALCVKRPKGAKAIADALGLRTAGGGPSITSRAETQARDLEIAQRVFELHSGETSLADAFASAAEEFRLSAEAVRDAWYRLTRRVPS